MKNADTVWDVVEAKRDGFFALSDRIWDMPETNYEEYRSAEEHARQLDVEGFRVERGIAGLPTAVMGEAGEGGPVIAILGEFDALPGMSQEAGIAEQREVKANAATATDAGITCWVQAQCLLRRPSRNFSQPMA